VERKEAVSMTCTCPDVVLNAGRAAVGKNWSDACEEHGVGTDYFRAMPVKPFGYGSEAKTTRAQWLKYLERDRQLAERERTYGALADSCTHDVLVRSRCVRCHTLCYPHA
jgi:hypothetical protein